MDDTERLFRKLKHTPEELFDDAIIDCGESFDPDSHSLNASLSITDCMREHGFTVNTSFEGHPTKRKFTVQDMNSDLSEIIEEEGINNPAFDNQS